MAFVIEHFENEVGVEPPVDKYTPQSRKAIPIYQINTFHILTQFVGYAKYMNRDNGNVFFRGQSSLYRTPDKECDYIVPAILRKAGPSISRINKYSNALNKSASKCRNLAGLEPDKLQPLLQHYGVKTAWLDIVDNLWVALWFGLHHFNSIILDGHEHVHISNVSDDEFAYIILILSDALKERSPGVFIGNKTKVTDLRKSCQSIYLRPHAQHALMIRKKEEIPYDYSDLIVGIVKIAAKDGFEWIGKDGLLSIQSLFPPTYFDYGFRTLLHEYRLEHESADFVQQFGSIQFISY